MASSDARIWDRIRVEEVHLYKLGLKLGRVQANMGELTVDPKEAYIFRRLFQQAKEKLTK